MTRPEGMEYKTAVLEQVQAAGADSHPLVNPSGIVDALVAVTGIKDDVGDILVPGSFARTLKAIKPKVCMGHDWNRPIGKVLDIKELLPGDPLLPKTTRDGKPWPREAGAVWARSKYNLDTPDGLAAFKMAQFYGTEECFQSIGYRVTPTGARHVKGVRYIDDLDLFEFGPVLHPANRYATLQAIKAADADGIENNAVQPGESKVSYVRDATYWGLPVGTPIHAGTKPRGKTALAERKKGKVPSVHVGVTAEKPDASAPVKRTPKQRQAEADSAGLFPEPDAPEGLRVRATKPRGKDDEYLQQIIDNFSAGYGTRDPEMMTDPSGATEDKNPLDGLLEEGITPAELRDELTNGTDWSDKADGTQYDKTETDHFVADVLDHYTARYNKLAREQARGGDTAPDATGDGSTDTGGKPDTTGGADTSKPKPDATDTGATDTGKPDATGGTDAGKTDTGATGTGTGKPDTGPDATGGDTTPPTPAKKTTDVTKMSDEELAAFHDAAAKDVQRTAYGTPKRKAASAKVEKAKAEQAKRLDASRRSVPAHPMDPQAYAVAQRVADQRRQRAVNVSERNVKIDKGNAEIVASEEAAANAPERIKKLPAGQQGKKVSLASNGRVAFRGKGTSNWAITSADGRAIVHPGSFVSGGRANVKLSGPQLDSLADRIAGITNAKGDRIPFTDPNSAGWVPGFRDSDGRDLQQAVNRVVNDWATKNGFTVSDSVKLYADRIPLGHAQSRVGTADAEGFHPQELINDIAAGDQIKLRDGSVKTVSSVDKATGRDADRYGVGVYTLTFDDGTSNKYSIGQRFDTKYAEGRNPDQEGYLNDPGMGYTSDSNLGQPLSGANAALIKMDLPNPVTAGTRILYTPGRDGSDNRPRTGTVTDKFTQASGSYGKWFQVIEYDDGTFDAVNTNALMKDGSLKTDPTPEETAAAHAAWGISAPDGGTPNGGGTPDGGGNGGITPDGGTTPTPDSGDSGPTPPTPNAGEEHQPARLVLVGDTIISPETGDELQVSSVMQNPSTGRVQITGSSASGTEMNMFGPGDPVRVVTNPRKPGTWRVTLVPKSDPSKARLRDFTTEAAARAFARKGQTNFDVTIDPPRDQGGGTPDGGGYAATGDLSKIKDFTDEQLQVELDAAKADFAQKRTLPKTSSEFFDAKMKVDALTTEQRRRQQGGDTGGNGGTTPDGGPTPPTPGGGTGGATGPADLSSLSDADLAARGAELRKKRRDGTATDAENREIRDTIVAMKKRNPKRSYWTDQMQKAGQGGQQPEGGDNAPPEPDGGLGAGEAAVSGAEIDAAEGAADQILGLSESPDGELEADPDVADRQDRVEELLTKAQTGGLNLAGETDDGLSTTRRDLVAELHLQEAVARRDKRKRELDNAGGGDQTGGDGTDLTGGGDGTDTGGGTDGGTKPKPEPKPKPVGRPGVAGAAEDLADAIDSGDQAGQADAIVRMESSIRRSRSESPHVQAMRDAMNKDGGLAAAIAAGDVTPESLRTFAKDLRDERKAAANTRARDRRAVKRLERDRLRGLIGEYDTEMRRRNLDPEKSGGAVPPAGDGSGTDVTPGGGTTPDLVVPDPAPVGPNGTRAEQMRTEPWRLIMADPTGLSDTQKSASTAAFADLAKEYAPVLENADPADVARIDALLAKKRGSTVSEAMVITMLLPRSERPAFMVKARTATTAYKANLAALTARMEHGDLDPTPAPDLASVAPGRIGWAGRLNALAPRARAPKAAGVPPFSTVSAVTAHLKGLQPPAGISSYQTDSWMMGRDSLIRQIDGAGKDVFLSPGGGLLTFRGDTKDGKRWFLIHTQTGASIPGLLNGSHTQQWDIQPNVNRGYEWGRYDLDGPAMRRLMGAMETTTDPAGRTVDFTVPDGLKLQDTMLGWRDYSADGTVRPAMIDGSYRDGDGLEAAAILEAVREDLPRYATTAAVHRAVELARRQSTAAAGTKAQQNQLHDQFSMSAGDLNYGRKRVRTGGIAETRTAAELKQDKVTAVAVDQADALVATGNPAEAVAVLRARSAELANGDAKRSPRYGSGRLDGLADHIAELHSPGQSEMDRLVGAQVGDTLGTGGAYDEPFALFRVTEPAKLVMTRPDGTKLYRMTLAGKDGPVDASIDTSDQYGVRITKEGDSWPTTLGQYASGSWAVFRQDDGQGAPRDFPEIAAASRRQIREFNTAAGFDDGGDSGGGKEPPPGPDGGPDITGGERTVAAEGKAIAVSDARQGDLVSIPALDGGEPFVGHIVGKEEGKLKDGATFDALNILGAGGETRSIPMDREGMIHRLEFTDQAVLDALPDFEGGLTINVGRTTNAIHDLPEGTPVRVVAGHKWDSRDGYRTITSGIIVRGPGGPMLKTADGRLLNSRALNPEGPDGRVTYTRLEMVHDPADVPDPSDKYSDNSKIVKVNKGDRVQVYVDVEDPAKTDDSTSRWVSGWVESVARPYPGEPQVSVLVRMPSGAAVWMETNDGKPGNTNRMRKTGGATKETRAAVAASGPRSSDRENGSRRDFLSDTVGFQESQVFRVAQGIVEGNPDGTSAADALRKAADDIAASEVNTAHPGAVGVYEDQLSTHSSLIQYFDGYPGGDFGDDLTLTEEAKQQAGAFLKDYAARALRSIADSVAEFEAIGDDDPERKKLRIKRAVRLASNNLTLRARAVQNLGAAHAAARLKADKALPDTDPAVSIPAAQRKKLDQGVAAAYQEVYEMLLQRGYDGSAVLGPNLGLGLKFGELSGIGGKHMGGVLNDIAPDRDISFQMRDKIQTAILDAAVAVVNGHSAKSSAKLRDEWQAMIDARAAGKPRKTKVPDHIGRVIDSQLADKLNRPKVDKSKPYTERVAALRKTLGADGIGKVSATRYQVTGDVLEGRLDLVETTGTSFDVDPKDKGPGRAAVAHLAAIRAMGEEVKLEAARLQKEKLAADKEYQQANKELDAATQTILRGAVEDAALQDTLSADIRRLVDENGLDLSDNRIRIMRDRLMKTGIEGSSLIQSGFGSVARSIYDRVHRDNAAAIDKYMSANAEYANAIANRSDIARKVKKIQAEALAETRREALAAVVELGEPGDAQVNAGGLKTLDAGQVQGYADWAARHYPKSWLKRAETVMATQQAARGFYSSDQQRIELSSAYDNLKDAVGGPYGQVFIHELGHHMEYTVPEITASEWIFHHARTSTGAVGERVREKQRKLSDITGGGGYTASETTMKDDFVHPYSGKVYWDRPDAKAWELFTMGMESLFAGSEHLDSDYENWILGTLAGVK